MNTIELTIDNETFTLDVEKAKRNGALQSRLNHPIKSGDVYVRTAATKGLINPYLLVEVFFRTGTNLTEIPRRWQLLGMGTSPNSNEFFLMVHTAEEIRDFLTQDRMTFQKNINSEIHKMVNS